MCVEYALFDFPQALFQTIFTSLIPQGHGALAMFISWQ
jgi:hypothetical protein